MIQVLLCLKVKLCIFQHDTAFFISHIREFGQLVQVSHYRRYIVNVFTAAQNIVGIQIYLPWIAMKAFKGDDELNRDAENALAILKEKIGEKIGHIKSAIDVTSRFMDDQILEDKAKSAQAIELINNFDLHKDFNYGKETLEANKDSGKLKGVNIPDKYRGLLD